MNVEELGKIEYLVLSWDMEQRIWFPKAYLNMSSKPTWNEVAVQWALESVVFNHIFSRLLENGYNTFWHFHFSTALAKFLLYSEWQTPLCINDQNLAHRYGHSQMCLKNSVSFQKFTMSFHDIVNVIYFLVSIIFELHLHWHVLSGVFQLRVINASLRSRRQPRKSFTAVLSLAAPGKMQFPILRYLAKWYYEVQATYGRVGQGWMNCSNELYRDFSRQQFWVSTAKVHSNVIAIGLIWKPKHLPKC